MPRNTSKSSRYVEINWSIDWQQGNYVTNTIKEIILRTLFLTQISECLTLREEIFARINFFSGHFAGINFLELGFTEDFVGINFRELSLTKDFEGINFKSALYKDFAGVNLTFALKKIFPLTLVYGLRTISVKIDTFLLKQMKE